MKVAIVCDWLVTYAGAEKVLEQILNVFPDADLFALVDFLDKDKKDFIKNKKVTTSFIQDLPKAKTKYQIVKDLINGTSVTFADVEKWAESKAGTKQVNSIPDELFNEMIKAISAKIEKDKKGDNQTPWDEN